LSKDKPKYYYSSHKNATGDLNSTSVQAKPILLAVVASQSGMVKSDKQVAGSVEKAVSRLTTERGSLHLHFRFKREEEGPKR
jgi:hypothetical protein